jgi:hypothetical protein
MLFRRVTGGFQSLFGVSRWFDRTVIARSEATRKSRRRFSVLEAPEHLQGRLDCHGPSALAMTGFWGVGALLLALGSLPRPFNNKGIRHGKAGETPSLRGAQRRGNPNGGSAFRERRSSHSLA